MQLQLQARHKRGTNLSLVDSANAGKRRLQKAMERMADKADFEVHWLPYQLNPGAPKEV